MTSADLPKPAPSTVLSGGPRILVAYQSQYGSTAEIANEIAATLAQGGAQVDVRHVETIDTIGDYDQVIVGAAIQYERWMPGAADFVRRHRAQLATKPVAMFFTCLALSTPGDRARDTATGYERKIRSIAPEIDPISVMGFAGVLDYARMKPATRLLVRAILRLRGAHAGDHRNWTEITAWAQDLDRLASASLPPSDANKNHDRPPTAARTSSQS